ncbi:MAG TPA: heavy-metal-associated domain-containing protein [Usitatibacteraceae bacterium]
METLNINVGGMTCGGCVKSVTRVLSALPGMEKTEVDLDKAMATVTFDPTKLDRAAIAEAIESAGYDAT